MVVRRSQQSALSVIALAPVPGCTARTGQVGRGDRQRRVGDPGGWRCPRHLTDNWQFEDGVWEKKLAPILANRIPVFAEIEILDAWIGHYEFNTYDQNDIVGAHSQLSSFIFVHGFSGHGTQQAPAMGRGISELITYGEYRELDLEPFCYGRLERGERLVERAVI